MERKTVTLRALYLFLGICFVLVLAPLLHWWAIPLGVLACGLFLAMPYYNDRQ